MVFDGSCKFGGHSLNRYLLQGPDLNNTLVGVLTRFRQDRIAISCDIAKMFHQFKVSKSHRDYLRFLWFHPEQNDRVAEYRMTVHVFGATSSPGCAKFGLLQLASDHEHTSPSAAAFLKNNFYVDDGLVSCATADEAIQLLEETRGVCAKGNLRLHKLLSNSLEVLESFPREEWSPNLKKISCFDGQSVVERMLGLRWCMNSDQFSFQFTSQLHQTNRRGILSVLASIFDPLGFLSPILLRGRLILQHMTNSLDWDTPLPAEIELKWNQWLEEMNVHSAVHVNRCFLPDDFRECVRAEVHVFADACEHGYGACCYLRMIDCEGNIHCSFLFSKARVVPLKKRITIPRLELQAAVLAARIGCKMQMELSFPSQLFLCSDSTIVLDYISNSAKRFHVFVSNRVSSIWEMTNVDQWHHVPGN